MKNYNYKTKGVCSKQISVSVDENNIITDVSFVSGCPGTLQGLSKLAVGMNAEDVIKKLHGISCKGKETSCPDQLSKALQEYLNLNEQEELA
ncbi:TIGR03905 family TSCPD domain-containing protein [Natranaerobius trueperi]|uniref:ribonucleoside-diphosphate reductase n=1 Tax=Natranaerobius trueperi TaxID=759412 RepID=A0A226BVB1_9FIRM|nr:TIGR03905 family TSCPD domain-containing protein [Natranaerobius trueperi]OWZ82915.1 TIGR03905 family protein [Natranaerobius trueperi]